MDKSQVLEHDDTDDGVSKAYALTQGLRPKERRVQVAPVAKSPPAAPVEGSMTYRSGKKSVAADNSAEGAGTSALQFLSELAQELTRGQVNLPCFPNVVIKIRDALNNPRTTIDATVRLVGTEPRLAARLIQTANSAVFNQSGKKITELKTAITRLGHQLVQAAAMAFAVQQMKDEPKLRSIAGPLKELWRESIAVASICQIIARRTKVRADEAFLAGLLHGIGRLYIMAHSVDQSAAVASELSRAELIAGWHPSIGKAVLEKWQVGESIAVSVSEQFEYSRENRRAADLTDVLIVSVLLADVMAEPPPRVLPLDTALAFGHLKMTQVDCDAAIKYAESQLASLQDALGCR